MPMPVVFHFHNLLIFLSLSLTFFHHTYKHVGADDKLIELACHNADVPTTCLQCLKSDPQAKKADKVGIATIIVSCLSDHAKHLATNMSDLASRAQDKEMKSICVDCGKGYFNATKDLSTATLQIKNGDYDDANRCVRIALEFEVTCHKSVEDQKSGFPASVLYEMMVYQQLSDAALRIIDRL